MNPAKTHTSVSVATSVSTRGGTSATVKVRNVCGSNRPDRADCPLLTPASLLQPELTDNEIPEAAPRPTADQTDVVWGNEILPLGSERGDQQLTNVLMSQATERSVFNKTEVVAGGWGFFPLTPPLFHLTPSSDSSSRWHSSDCRRSDRPDVGRAPHPAPPLSDEEEGRRQLRSGAEAHLHQGSHHRDLRVAGSSPSSSYLWCLASYLLLLLLLPLLSEVKL